MNVLPKIRPQKAASGHGPVCTRICSYDCTQTGGVFRQPPVQVGFILLLFP